MTPESEKVYELAVVTLRLHWLLVLRAMWSIEPVSKGELETKTPRKATDVTAMFLIAASMAVESSERESQANGVGWAFYSHKHDALSNPVDLVPEHSIDNTSCTL